MDLRKLSLTRFQAEHLIKELGSYDELHWLNLMLKFPLSVERCRNLPFYHQLSTFIHLLKPGFPRSLQLWLAFYFTVIFRDGQVGTTMETAGNFTAWDATFVTGTSTITVSATSPHHGANGAKVIIAGAWERAVVDKTFGAETTLHVGCAFKVPALASNAWGIQAPIKILDSGVHTKIALYLRNNAGTYGWGYRYANDGVGGMSGYIYSAEQIPVPGTVVWVEARVVASATVGEVHVFIDGNELTDMEQTGLDNGADGMVDASLGSDGDNNITSTFYFDCVVIADAYIGPEVDVGSSLGLHEFMLKMMT